MRRNLARACMTALALVAADGLAAEADRGTPPAADATVVLNEYAYFRQHLVFGLERLSARPLKEDAETAQRELRPPMAGLARIEKNAKKLLEGRGFDWTETDWRDVAVYHFSRTQCGVDERGAMMLPALWPAGPEPPTPNTEPPPPNPNTEHRTPNTVLLPLGSHG